jgi:hypothetical protein
MDKKIEIIETNKTYISYIKKKKIILKSFQKQIYLLANDFALHVINSCFEITKFILEIL